MKLKLIDEDWIDNAIKKLEEKWDSTIPSYLKNTEDIKVLPTAIFTSKELLKKIKEQLKSPIEEIKEAIEHGLNAYPEFDRTSNYDYESRKEGLKEIQDEYLKEKGYE